MSSKPGIHIDKVAVEGLGPLTDRTFKLSRLNLIFGRNESGKTFFVEFLLRSLFRHANQWPLRPAIGGGKVFIQGPSRQATFSPNDQEKIEDWLEEHELVGLPANLARLLVVRAGELELDGEASGGLDKRVLADILSSQQLLNELQSKIQTTVQQAEFENGEILGAQRGELKRLRELEHEAIKIDQMLEQVEARLSGARLAQLDRELAELERAREAQLKAKRHQAFVIHREIMQFESELRSKPMEAIEAVDQALDDLQRAEARLEQLSAKLEQAGQESANYHWLTQALRVWQDNQLGDLPRKHSWGLFVGLAAATASGLLLLARIAVPGLSGQAIRLAWGSLALLALAIISLGFYIQGLRRALSSRAQMQERVAISEEYEHRFQEAMGGLANLQEKFEQEREANSRREVLETEITELEREKGISLIAFEQGLQALGGQMPKPEERRAEVDKLTGNAKAIQAKITEHKLALSRLSIEPSEYRQEPAPAPFDKDELESLERRIDTLQAERQTAANDLDGLKGEVARFTGSDVRDSWQQVLEALWSLRQKTHHEYRSLTASVLGQIALSKVLAELQSQEDEKIRQGLADPAIGEWIQQLTGRYTEAKLHEGQLLIGSEAADYPLAELSTGAQEQVLMALRLAFASKLIEDQPLFLVLDDAFQHSDWERREQLVGQALALAESGWQVIYLTMDNHLRDLFVTQGKPAFGEEFAAFEI